MVYGRTCTGLGKTPAEVSRMLMRDVQRLFRYWGKQPLVHELVGGYLGITYSTKKKPRMATADDVRGLVAAVEALA